MSEQNVSQELLAVLRKMMSTSVRPEWVGMPGVDYSDYEPLDGVEVPPELCSLHIEICRLQQEIDEADKNLDVAFQMLTADTGEAVIDLVQLLADRRLTVSCLKMIMNAVLWTLPDANCNSSESGERTILPDWKLGEEPRSLCAYDPELSEFMKSVGESLVKK